VLLIVLDGRTVNEGASFELGVAYALEKTCLGLQTDPRRLLPIGNNPMIDAALSQVFASIHELICWASRWTPDGASSP
jgi:nucleoside 2-deoxyribosyltransferase